MTPQDSADKMQLASLPYNVLWKVFSQLSTADQLRLASTCSSLFNMIVPRVYSTIMYYPSEGTTNSDLPFSYMTLIDEKNAAKFFWTLSETAGRLRCRYSHLVQRLYLTQLSEPSVFNLAQWRATNPEFPILEVFEFPESIQVEPFTFNEAPELTTVYIDENFCHHTEVNAGSVAFIDFSHINRLYFKPRLGRNEDMVMFNLLTKNHRLASQLKALYFMVDEDSDSADQVYRRLVGVFALLRRMGLVLRNLSSISMPLTNHSTPVIIDLVSRHIYFENLTSLELNLEDDGGDLKMVAAAEELADIVSQRGSNIKQLSLVYRLLRDDPEKNHLRAYLVLKLLEPFRQLTHLNIDLQISDLNLSNLIMMIATPISHNLDTLKDIRINLQSPSSLIGNLLPSLSGLEQLFPSLNWLPISELKLRGESQPHSEVAAKVSQLMIVGSELDKSQKGSGGYSFGRERQRFMKTEQSGALFDYIVSRQLNQSLQYEPKLQLFELCGIVYRATVDHHFERVFGEPFQGLDEATITDINEMSQVLGGDMHREMQTD